MKTSKIKDSASSSMKIFNLLALASFGISISLLGGTVAGYFYLKNPVTQEKIKNDIIQQLTPSINKDVPDATGGVIPTPSFM